MAKVLGCLFVVICYKHFAGVISDGLLTLSFTKSDCTGFEMQSDNDRQELKLHMLGASKAGNAYMELLGFVLTYRRNLLHASSGTNALYYTVLKNQNCDTSITLYGRRNSSSQHKG
jgi:hypothetical protein